VKANFCGEETGQFFKVLMRKTLAAGSNEVGLVKSGQDLKDWQQRK